MDEDCVTIKAILQGDIERYRQLMETYEKTVYTIVARRIPAGMINSVAQDVFVRAYNALGNYKEKQQFPAWLSRIAIRTCYDYWRQQKRFEKKHLITGPGDDQQAWIEQAAKCNRKEEADYLAQQNEAVETIQWVLSQLSPEDRTLIESIYWDDMKLKDVATILDWSLVKTKVRAMRARRKMKKLLESIGEFQ
jgi:RNA polymerase sigma-70 factor (ECF subfamily)